MTFRGRAHKLPRELDYCLFSDQTLEASWEEHMGESSIPFKTNVNQKIAPFRKRRARPSSTASRPIKATKVDPAKEKTRRIKWVVKWVWILPMGAYVLVWLLLILFDLFNT
jgi:hypothetical protein